MKNNNTAVHILLAEDDIDDRFFFEKALKLIPIETKLTTVNDGDKLMEYLANNQLNLPDIIFLDISMPRKTGIECLQEIKENEEVSKVPIAMLSTSYTKDDAFENDIKSMLIRMGAERFIRKPNSIEELKTILEEILIAI
jgi:CheY-like chemotaxis protein